MENSKKLFTKTSLLDNCDRNEKLEDNWHIKIKKQLENEVWALPFFILFIIIFSWWAIAACFEDLPSGVIFAVFDLFFLCGIIWGVKTNKSMLNHINNWTVIKKKVKVISFSYYSYDDDHIIKSWYEVFASDWLKMYSRNFAGAVTRSRPLLIQEAKDVECKIKSLEEQLKYVWRKDKIRIKNEIKWLQLKNKYLLYNGKEIHIWDEVTLYFDPDNPRNYIMDI